MVKFEDPVTDVPFSTRSLEVEKANATGTTTGKSTKWTDEENAMMTVTGTFLWSSTERIVVVKVFKNWHGSEKVLSGSCTAGGRTTVHLFMSSSRVSGINAL